MTHPLEAWRTFARHADECRECEVGAAHVRRSAGDPRKAWDLLCDAGRALFEEWLAAVQELALEMRAKAPLAPLIPSAREDPHGAEERAVVLTQLPQTALDSIRLARPDAQEGMVRAAVAAHRAGGVITKEPDAERRTCAYEGCREGVNGTSAVFNVSARHRDQRFCTDRCRKMYSRPRLINTEE